MGHHNEHFTPENIDEEIDKVQSAQTQSEPPFVADVRLIEILQHIYQNESRPEDQFSLVRVKQRIAAQQMLVSQELRAQEGMIEIQQSRQEKDPFRHGRQVVLASGGMSIFYRGLSMFAAVAMLGLILGSFLLVVSRVTHLPARPAAQVNVQQNVYVANENIVYKLKESDGSLLWKRTFGTYVYSSLDTLAVQYADGIVYANDQDMLYALNANDGAILWQTAISTYHFLQIFNGSIYIVHPDYTLSALDAETGRQRWINTTFHDAYNYKIYNDILYVKTTKNDLYVFDGETGNERWHYNEASLPDGLMAPLMLVTVADGVVYDVAANNLYALNARDGRLLWQKSVAAGHALTALQVVNKVVYTSSAMVVPQLHGQEITSFPPKWVQIPASFANDHIYAFTQNGDLQWISDRGYHLYTLLPVSNGLVFAQGDVNGSFLYALHASNGKLSWQIAQDYNNMMFNAVSETIVKGTLYISKTHTQSGAGSTLAAFDLQSGKQLSMYPLNGSLITPGMSSQTQLYTVGTTDPRSFNVYRLDLTNGSLSWTYKSDSAPVFEDMNVYAVRAASLVHLDYTSPPLVILAP